MFDLDAFLAELAACTSELDPRGCGEGGARPRHDHTRGQ